MVSNPYKYCYNRAKLTLSIDERLIKLAKVNKFNISRFLEEKLSENLIYKNTIHYFFFLR